jgi:uncharacterized membrane protein YqjE
MSEPGTNGGTAPAGAAPQAAAVSLQHVLRAVRTSGSGLLAQGALHLQLLRIEWAEERVRLRSLVVATLFGFACLLALLGAGSALWLALFWDTRYRLPAAAALVAGFALGLGLAWQRCQALLRQGEHSFADSRRELAADLDLLCKPQ